jgi:beta-lactamase regulating signal transducer with metallopeptidase domain
MTESAVLQALVDASIRAVLIAMVVRITLAALRVRQGSVRHIAWTAVLLAMLVLPVMPKWLPALPAPLATPSIAPVLPASSERTVQAQVLVETRATTAPVKPLRSSVDVVIVPPAAPVTLVPPPAPFAWRTFILVLWGLGAIAMAARLLFGWWRAVRLAAHSQRVGEGLYESPLVAAPVAIGVFNPRIVLPSTWTLWPAGELRTVRIHEAAHIRRHDGLTSLLAGLNTCVFWFHPLSWWLERQVAIAAEEACDDEVIRASVEPHRYAETLVRMADAVRHRGQRVEWQAVGMAGASLAARIDRVLNGRAAIATPAVVRFCVAAMCAAVIVPGVACSQNPPALAPDPDLAAVLKKDQERVTAWETARDLSLPQVAELEAKVAINPDDLDATRQLLTFYGQSGQRLMGWNRMVAARRGHLLRVIERHPESEMTFWPLKQSLDPEGWTRARALWLKHLSAPTVGDRVFSNAARFFGISEKPMAEQILLRAQATSPDGPQPRSVERVYSPGWSYQLGRLYASAIVGSDDEMLGYVVKSVSLAESQTAFAKGARTKLEQTKDALMLQAAGDLLTRTYGRNGTVGEPSVNLGFDHVALGGSYLDRAIALDPNSPALRSIQARRRHMKAYAQLQALLEQRFGKTFESVTAEDIKTLPDTFQLEVLPEMPSVTHTWAGTAPGARHSAAQLEQELARARALAEAQLAVADRMKADARSKPASYAAHLNLGLLALRTKDRRGAVDHLRAAAESIAGGDLRETVFPGVQYRLTTDLLNSGERESVAGFFDQVSKVPGPDQVQFAKSASAIRAGRMPDHYQRQMTR